MQRGVGGGGKSAATLLLVAGRSIMGVIPPFDWRDVETFEDGVAYICLICGYQLILCTHSVYGLCTRVPSHRGQARTASCRLRASMRFLNCESYSSLLFFSTSVRSTVSIITVTFDRDNYK